MSSHTKDEYKFLKEATFGEFQELFVEWYLPALQMEATKLRELEKKVKDMTARLKNIKGVEIKLK